MNKIKRKIASVNSIERANNINEFIPIVLIDLVTRTKLNIVPKTVVTVKYGDNTADAKVFEQYEELVGKKTATINNKLATLLKVPVTESGEILSKPKSLEISTKA